MNRAAPRIGVCSVISRSSLSLSNRSPESVACRFTFAISVLLVLCASRPLRVITALHPFQQARRGGTAKPLAAAVSIREQRAGSYKEGGTFVNGALFRGTWMRGVKLA